MLRSPFRPVDPGHPWPLALLALLILFGTIWANTIVWPVEHLGYSIDPRSGQVTQVAPGSTAALAGIQPGDQLQRVYGYPWREAVFGWSQWRMVARSTTHVAVTVERAGETFSFDLPRRPPETTHQIAKIVFGLLGAACWTTGVLLGLGKRHEVNGSRLVALFWLVLGGVLGSYVFAIDLCFPLWALFIWLITTILPALAIVVHVWFPARAVSRRRSVIAQWFLVGVWVGSNALLVGSWLIWQPRLADLLAYAWVPLVVALVITFLGSGLLLVDAYRHVRTPHVRRQIRLIAAACLISAIVWVLFRVVPLILGVPPLLPEAVIDLVPILIPLAYLVSGTATSLYTLDRLIRRVVLELMVITLVVITFSATALYVARSGREAIVWSALLMGVLIHPLVGWSRRLRGEQGNPDRSYEALRRARHLLTTSLDPAFLLLTIREGIQGAFDRPPIAIYQAEADADDTLILVQQDGFPDLPPALPVGTLTNGLQRGATIVEARALHLELRATPLTADEEAAVRHQGIALWGVVQHKRGTLLAIVLIGTDVSLEPYRAEDCRVIEDVLDAAALALAHSSAYERLRQTEAMMRELFDAMRRVEDEKAAELARTVHDDIVNNDVQLNIMALQTLLIRTPDQPMCGELERVLKREQKISRALRGVCERLHPTGIDDPMGLPGVLRGLKERVLVIWQGTCEMQITGVAVPIDSAIQLEIYRIAREALINAVKHADATVITIRLHYPACPDDPLTLIVADNGCSGKRVQQRPGHWGIRNMYESARIAGGELHFVQALGGGAEVMLTFHAARNDSDVPRERPIIGRQVRTA